MHYTAVSSTTSVHLGTTQLSAVQLQYTYALHSCKQYAYTNTCIVAVSPTQKIPVERNSPQLLEVCQCQNCEQQAVRCRTHNSLPLLGAQNQRDLFRTFHSTTIFSQLLFVGNVIQFARQYQYTFRQTISSFRCFREPQYKVWRGGVGGGAQ